jgi:hypothetical protein
MSLSGLLRKELPLAFSIETDGNNILIGKYIEPFS